MKLRLGFVSFDFDLFHFVSICLFRSVSFCFVSSSFVSFLFVSHFDEQTKKWFSICSALVWSKSNLAIETAFLTIIFINMTLPDVFQKRY